MCDARNREQEHSGRLPAVMAYFLANGLFQRKEPVPLSAFLPESEETTQQKHRRQTAEEQIAIMKVYTMIARANKKPD